MSKRRKKQKLIDKYKKQDVLYKSLRIESEYKGSGVNDIPDELLNKINDFESELDRKANC